MSEPSFTVTCCGGLPAAKLALKVTVNDGSLELAPPHEKANNATKAATAKGLRPEPRFVLRLIFSSVCIRYVKSVETL